ncbi:MAG: hypothetical protein HC800_23645 [Phormidesmis sp. RL_2_1]|nr:hypothetical protein [Phormidesmis sp. RL_2_1]
MAIDQATADYEREQEKRAALQDAWADWHEHETSESLSQPLPPVCAQCVNWQADRRLYLADGSTQLSPGYCAARAAADLPQMSQEYAERCRFYEEDCPF